MIFSDVFYYDIVSFVCLYYNINNQVNGMAVTDGRQDGRAWFSKVNRYKVSKQLFNLFYNYLKSTNSLR